MLGFTAFQLLAGDRIARWIPKLGHNGNQADWIRWHSSPFETLPPLAGLLPEIPASLAEVIGKLCTKPVAERYATAEDALQDLNAVSEAVSAAVVTAPVDAQAMNNTVQSAGVTLVGGSAPLMVTAEEEAQHAPDLLEILQDPAVIWQYFRASKQLQFLSVGAAAFFLVAMLLVPGNANEGVPPRQTASVKSKPARDNTTAFDRATQDAESAVSDNATVTEPTWGSAAVNAGDVAVYEDRDGPDTGRAVGPPASGDSKSASRTTSLRETGRPKFGRTAAAQLHQPPQAVRPVSDVAPTTHNRSVTVTPMNRSSFSPREFAAAPGYRAFEGIELRTAETEHFCDEIRRLARADAQERDAIYRLLKRIAPQDPRTHFVYAVNCGLTGRGREALDTAHI